MRTRIDLRRFMTGEGFQLIRDKKHLIWGCPCGKHLITTPATPSDSRTFNNIKADARRTLRLCG